MWIDVPHGCTRSNTSDEHVCIRWWRTTFHFLSSFTRRIDEQMNKLFLSSVYCRSNFQLPSVAEQKGKHRSPLKSCSKQRGGWEANTREAIPFSPHLAAGAWQTHTRAHPAHSKRSQQSQVIKENVIIISYFCFCFASPAVCTRIDSYQSYVCRGVAWRFVWAQYIVLLLSDSMLFFFP